MPLRPATFHATGLFRYPLKTSENLWFSDVFRGYRNRPVAWNGLKCNVKIANFFITLGNFDLAEIPKRIAICDSRYLDPKLELNKIAKFMCRNEAYI